MSNYHFEVTIISRGKGRSVTSSVSYISGRALHDIHNGKTYYKHREDLAWQKIFLPDHAPAEFRQLQHLCDEIECAEMRWDARTARQLTASLPNELPLGELVRIVHEFVADNFTSQGLCTVAAIHRKHNHHDPKKNNPHVHMIVPTRPVGPDGFCKLKDREHDKRKYITIWREQWATVQNRAYERNGLDIQVSHESLEAQGKHDREPTIHLSRIDWQRERRGERTPAGDRKRAVKERNQRRIYQREMEQRQEIELELYR
jgi:ATP-dependent exoDNAse (exonuclease V) alpha subunit